MSAVYLNLCARDSHGSSRREFTFAMTWPFVVAAWPHTQAQLPCVEEEMDNRGGKCKVEKQGAS